MNSEILAVGTYTNYVPNAPGACGKGILILQLNKDSGDLTYINSYKIINPSYLSWSEIDRKLYSCNETNSGTGQINSFYIDEKNNYSITPLHNTDSKGSALCYISKPDVNGTLFVTSYNDGSMSKVSQDNNGFTIDYTQKYIGHGPNLSRQEKPHAHQIVYGPNNNYIYICDLGSDKIWIDNKDNNKPTTNRFLDLPGGYGPRHLTFNKSGEYAYILCELEPRIVVAKVENESGLLKIVNDYPSTFLSSKLKAEPAAIKLHPSGKTLAVSNRVINTISIFKVLDNELIFIEEFNSQGEHPREIYFSKDGKWLLIANQDSNNIIGRSFDPITGEPEKRWSTSYSEGTPICIINIDTISKLF